MTEFGAAAMLELEVPDSELRSARQAIEDGVGDVAVDVTLPPSQQRPMADGGASMGGMDRNALQTLAEERNEHLAELVDLLEDSGTLPTSGGGSGGGGLGAGIGAGIGAGGALTGGLTALGAGGIMGAGGVAGSAGRNVLQDLVPDSFATQDEQISGTSYAWSEEDGFGGSAEPVLNGEALSAIQDGIDITQPDWLSTMTEFQWLDPEIVSEFDNLQWPELPNLSQEVDWPSLPNLSQEVSWPELPEPSQDFWPSMPNPLDQGGDTHGDGVETDAPGTDRGYDRGSRDGRLDVNMDGKITVDDGRKAAEDIAQEAADIIEREVLRQGRR